MKIDPFMTPAEAAMIQAMNAAEAAGKDRFEGVADAEIPEPEDDEPAIELMDELPDPSTMEGGDKFVAKKEGEKADEKPAAKADEKADPKADDKGEGEGEGEGEGKVDDVKTVEVDELEEDDDEPTPDVVKPTDFETAKKALRAERKAAKDKLNAGEISDDEFDKLDDEISDKLEAIVQEAATEKALMRAYEVRSEKYQTKVIGNLMVDSAKNDGFDYVKNKTAQVQFDNIFNAMRAANPKQPFKAAAADAHRTVLAMHGIVKTAPQKKDAATIAAEQAAAAVEKTKEARKPPKAPVTLREIPAADTNKTSSSLRETFAKLKGPQIEEFWNRLTPAQKRELQTAEAN